MILVGANSLNQGFQTLQSCIHYAKCRLQQGVHLLPNKLNEIVNRVALAVFNQVNLGLLIDVAMSFTLFYLHPIVFHIGLVSGFLYYQQVREIAKDVNSFYLYMDNPNHSCLFNLMKKTALTSALGIYCILNMSPSLITMVFYYSAKWGALLRTRSIEIKQQMGEVPLRV